MAEARDLLDEIRIRALLAPDCAARLQSLSVLRSVDSTNTRLLQSDTAFPAICIAEQQTAGRGRRGRVWVSPDAANLYLSLGWDFGCLPAGFTALAMVAAIAVVAALHALDLHGISIKWPNDLYAAGKKFAGILVDTQGEAGGRLRAVIGVGINVRMPRVAAVDIDQPWTDLAAFGAGHLPGRNELAAAIITALMASLDRFAVQGFRVFADDWRALDLVAGRAVELHQHASVVRGTARGVDDNGALLLETAAGTQRYLSGDLSLRLAT